MKIGFVTINNWYPPGQTWWDEVESKPDEPLIDATIRLKLTFREYEELLIEDRKQEAA